MTFTLYHNDCLDVLTALATNSVDSIVTDPPYGLSDHKPIDVVACLTAWLAGDPYVNDGKGFMAKSWDAWVPGPEVWRECYRVLKPGGYLLCFAGSRSYDLMGIAIRLAGFRAHPMLGWITGQGFPKATNLSKRFDSDADAARQWDDWYYGRQSLKPALEPILMFQKPPDRAMTDNVLAWGTGAVNIAACRVEGTVQADAGSTGFGSRDDGYELGTGRQYQTAGRWPANLLHDGSDEVAACFPVTTSPATYRRKTTATNKNAYGRGIGESAGKESLNFGDTGSASRFFPSLPLDAEDMETARVMYCAKASGDDRWFYCRDCRDAFPGKVKNQHTHGHKDEHDKQIWKHIEAHNTVKPTALLRWLVRLVTPPGGVVLDPFCGSGSTLKACVLEGFDGIGIDLNAEYLEITRQRIEAAELPLLRASAP